MQHQTEKALYKDQKQHIVSDDEMIKISGVVPAIVSPELWRKANDVIAERNQKKMTGIPENKYKNLVFCGKCENKVSISFKRKYSEYDFNCRRCKSGVFASEKNMNKAVRNHLKLPENAEITSDLLNERLEKIVIFDRKNIVFIDRGD